jgi:hypothetical protein
MSIQNCNLGKLGSDTWRCIKMLIALLKTSEAIQAAVCDILLVQFPADTLISLQSLTLGILFALLSIESYPFALLACK